MSVEPIEMDGAGNIDTVNPSDEFSTTGKRNHCLLKGEGHYMVRSDASGTANLVIPSVGGGVQSVAFDLDAAQEGASFFLVENDGTATVSVTALKQ
jgi:hypothetical protein